MFGERLKAARMNRGLSQAELARLVVTSQQHVYRWESSAAVNSDTIRVLCQALEVSADYLLELSDDLTRKAGTLEPLPVEQEVIRAFRIGDKLAAIKVIINS